MRWGAGDRSFVRPVRGVVALLGGQIVPLELYGVAAGDRTAGHRVLADGEIVVTGPDDYLAKLREGFVEPDPEVRRIAILEKARALAVRRRRRRSRRTRTSRTRWRTSSSGRASCAAPSRRSFSSCPRRSPSPSCARTRSSCRCAAPPGLLPHFVAVMDNDADRKGFIAKGCEWVLNARLADARFFYEEDAKETLEAQLPKLVAPDLPGEARRLPAEDRAHPGPRGGDRGPGRPLGPRRSRRARRRCSRKADLTSLVVKEFTDLQGVIGGLYARRERYPDSVWKADLRPVPSGLGLGRSAAGGLRRDPLARRPVRLALRSLPRRPRPDGIEGPVRPAPRGARHRLDHDRPQLADRLAPDRAQGAVALSAGPRGPRARQGRRGARALLRGPAPAACSSGAARATTRSRPC